MGEEPQSRFHGKVKVQKGDIEIQVNIFEETREKLYKELNEAFVTLGKWVEAAPKPGAPVATAAAKPAAVNPGNGGPAAPSPVPKLGASAPICLECGEECRLVSWTDKKSHQAMSRYKCPHCDTWAPKKQPVERDLPY